MYSAGHILLASLVPYHIICIPALFACLLNRPKIRCRLVIVIVISQTALPCLTSMSSLSPF
ncbi:hypothetical protein B0J18DRAFT_429723 [Chaetomium sp. MPI-SDFR-AT-0129]|nr:hypothetical protein B0J18DRAFT_429723 [Chaetomium sp. MPI-SDFR-AT-0129]